MNHEGTRVRGNQVRSTVATAMMPTLLDDGINYASRTVWRLDNVDAEGQLARSDRSLLEVPR